MHIIDLYSFEPEQWIDLLHTFKAQPEGLPCVKITGIHDQRVVLEQMAIRLMAEASKLEIPFHFIPIVSKLENVDPESFCVDAGEAIAISAVFQLHSLLAFDEEVPRRISPVASKRPLRKFLDEVSPDFTSPSSILSPSFSPKMRNFLSFLWRLSPKVMVIAEQEANHNGFSLTERVKEALDFYAPLFDCLDSIRSIAPTERQMIEKMIFGEEIKNIIACEGTAQADSQRGKAAGRPGEHLGCGGRSHSDHPAPRGLPESLRGSESADPYQREDDGRERSEERHVGKECRSRWSPYH